MASRGEVTKCAKATWGSTGRGGYCNRKATTEIDGKMYCTQHAKKLK